MTIQISVVIWTVLSFIVLMLVLNKFLFKPILQVMDERNDKIRKSKDERRIQREKYEARKLEIEKMRITAQKEAMEKGEQALEEAKAERARLVSAAKEEIDLKIEKQKELLEKESEEIEKQLDSKVDELALDYVKKLVS